MRFNHRLIRTLILPNNAGPNDARIVIGPDITAELKAKYGANIVANLLFYRNGNQYEFFGDTTHGLTAGSVNIALGFAGESWNLTTDGVVTFFRIGDVLGATDNVTEFEAGAGNSRISVLCRHVDFFNIDMTRFSNTARMMTDIQEQIANAPVTLTTVRQVVASVTTTSGGANSRYRVTGSIDIEYTVAGNSIAVGELRVDGVVVTGNIICFPGAANVGRWTQSRVWTGTEALSGNHTFELVVSKTAALATIVANAGSVVLAEILE